MNVPFAPIGLAAFGLSLTLAVVAAVPAPGRAAPDGLVVDTASGNVLTVEDLSERLLAADVVVLGETHDSRDHHRRQAAIIADLAAAGRRPAVVFEMLSREQQPAIDAFLAGGEPASGFGDAVDWARNWNAFEIYEQVIAAAMAAKLPVVAGDVPREERRRIGKEGVEALAEETRTAFGLDRPLPEAITAHLSDILVASHCGMIPPEATGPMIDVQRLRDGAMAAALRERLGAAPENRPAVLIAGAGHARRDFGVPAVLAALDPELHVLALAFVPAPPGAAIADLVERDVYGEPLYDVVVATADDRPAGDPCTAMRARAAGKTPAMGGAGDEAAAQDGPVAERRPAEAGQ